MPREPRIKDDYGVYYITQRCSSERDLFRDEEDRNKFLSILTDAKEKNGFKVYAYCILKNNEYRLIIDANGSDISKVMKGINISYAMYANHSGSLYRDRYKSVLIKDKDTLMDILHKIHEEAQSTNSIYNSCSVFNKDHLVDSKLIDEKDIELLNSDKDCFNKNDSCKNCIKTTEEALKELNKISSAKALTKDELLKNKALRNELIKDFRKNSTLSLNELGEVFGGLSESSICKILNSK